MAMLKAPPEKDIFTTPENATFYGRRQYARLRPEDHEIRLLRIHPTRLTVDQLASTFPEWVGRDTDVANPSSIDEPSGTSSTFICCQLLEASKLELLDRKYVALSYCAGKSTETRRIMVDGYWFNAFANLEHALEGFREHHDRSSSGGNLIWTDQVCINQVDFEEKSHQVGFMRKIYENAGKTYVVLSTPQAPLPDAEAGVSALRLALKHIHARLLVNPVSYAAEAYRNCYSVIFLDWIYKDPDHPVCGVLGQLLSFLDSVSTAKWWTRAWVFQEFIVSRNIYFICGSQCLEMNDLLPFLQFHGWNIANEETVARFKLRSNSPHSQRIAHNVELLKKSATHCRQSETSYELPRLFLDRRMRPFMLELSFMDNLLFLIATVSSCGFQATDPRDLLYAFAGLASITSGIKADYSPSNTMSDVCVAMAESFIEHGPSLSILRRAATTRLGNPSSGTNLPSWVPDWTSSAPWIWYGHLPWTIPPAERYYLAGKALCVQGVHLATLGEEAFDGVFQAMGHDFDTTALVQSGDELWVIHGGTGIHALRKREERGHVLVGIAILLQGKVLPSSPRGFRLMELEEPGLSEYMVVTDAIEASLTGVESIEIF